MKQYWTSEEITEHWLLLPDEMLLLKNKTGNTRLGFDKRALSPLIYHHINPYGVFNLDLNTRLSLEG